MTIILPINICVNLTKFDKFFDKFFKSYSINLIFTENLQKYLTKLFTIIQISIFPNVNYLLDCLLIVTKYSNILSQVFYKTCSFSTLYNILKSFFNNRKNFANYSSKTTHILKDINYLIFSLFDKNFAVFVPACLIASET